MAIVFPRPMPSVCRITDATLQLEYQQARSLPGGGGVQAVDLGPPLWAGAWTVRVLTAAEAGEWDAWLLSLAGSRRTFQASPRRRRLRLYPAGVAGWSGVGSLATIGAARDTITVSGVAAGVTVSVGDHISFPVGSRQHLHRVLEAGTASGAGNLTLTVGPPLHRSAVTGVDVRFDAPWCDMTLREAPSITTDVRGGTFMFTGRQVLI